MADISKLRHDFPILERNVNGKPLAYLDNAATTQKPRQVIESLAEYYETCNSNIHRGIHYLSELATEKYEGTRSKVAEFIGARSPREIIFTRNTTESLNLVAYSIGGGLNKGDNIVSTVMEHHSNLVPWQMLRERGVEVRFVDIDESGHLKTEQFGELVDEKTRIVSVTQASNVLGTINDAGKIAKIAHAAGAIFVVDGAQSAPHMDIDVGKTDADLLAFSAHKMLGPTGVGVLYGKRDVLEDMKPFLFGGDMIKSVTLESTEFNVIPNKFEAGTPNIADVIAFGSAIDYLKKAGMENLRKHEVSLTKHALDEMSGINGMTIYGPEEASEKTGVVSFNVDGIHPHDMSEVLNGEGIAIRSGHACAMPLMNRLGCESVSRASFYVYNTEDEIRRLVSAIKKAGSIFRS